MSRTFQLLFVSCLAAMVSAQYPQDTPEVAQAKAEHFRAYNAAAAQAAPGSNAYQPQYQPQPQYTPQYQQQGPIPDTPEVAQAKAEHLRAHQQAAAASQGQGQQYQPQQYQPQPQHYQPQPQYQQPQYQPQQQQTVADTPEVAQAKAEHFRAHQAALARGNDGNNNQQYQPQPQYNSGAPPSNFGFGNGAQQPFYNSAPSGQHRPAQVSLSQNQGGFNYNYQLN